MPQFSFIGDSGNTYTYVLTDPNGPGTITPQGGNYIFARGGSAGPRIVYAGQADNILHEIISTTLWNEARQAHHADLLYVHPQLNLSARLSEQADLVAGHHPPMNP